MYPKLRRLKTIDETGVILIIRLDDADVAYRVAEAAIEGGVRAVEVTYSVPRALSIVERLADAHRDDGTVIGVGTVVDAESAFAAVNAGAGLLVSPNLSPEMITVGNRYQAVTMSGALTPSEILDTASAGADIVKLFPTGGFGPEYLKTVMAPLAQVPIAPAGGVTPDNAHEWFAAGACAVGVGSAVTKAGGPHAEPSAVTAAARDFLDAVRRARQSVAE
ncbi:MAG: bifunctional 4-hydroxy-2-oxoglutarate aldolase/2-dehydro-3-deoxy-phosphogluconate aldolase [Nostocoides sp.]